MEPTRAGSWKARGSGRYRSARKRTRSHEECHYHRSFIGHAVGRWRSRFHSTAIASASSRGAPIYCLSSRRSLGSLRDQEARRVPARAGHATPARTDRRTDGCRTVRRQCRNRFRQSQKAARQMAAAIRGRKPHVYITRRWRLVAWLLRVLPEAVYSRI